jgi:hypothetical protein
MLNILEKKKNIFDYKTLDTHIIKEHEIECKKNNPIQDKLDINEYKNIIYYTPSSKE